VEREGAKKKRLSKRTFLNVCFEFLRRSRGSSRTRARRGSRTCKKSKEERARKSELSRERFLERGKSGEKSFFSFFLELQASETSSINLLFRQSFVRLLFLLLLRFPSVTMVSGTPHARVTFSAEGGTLAVASADGRLKTFDTGEFGKREKQRERERASPPPPPPPACFSLSFSALLLFFSRALFESALFCASDASFSCCSS
jgi:hypothetical protein